ncbi:MAG: ACT domain-containing protein, partial [Gallionella sp.]|nr:ACT domain-containing protein [Gallionella sp.]
LAFQPDQLSDLPILPLEEVETACYLRLRALDKPGVLADVTRILADLNISIEAMIQNEPAEGEEQADVVLLTHVAREKDINAAIHKIETLASIHGKVTRIRMEALNG